MSNVWIFKPLTSSGMVRFPKMSSAKQLEIFKGATQVQMRGKLLGPSMKEDVIASVATNVIAIADDFAPCAMVESPREVVHRMQLLFNSVEDHGVLSLFLRVLKQKGVPALWKSEDSLWRTQYLMDCHSYQTCPFIIITVKQQHQLQDIQSDQIQSEAPNIPIHKIVKVTRQSQSPYHHSHQIVIVFRVESAYVVLLHFKPFLGHTDMPTDIHTDSHV